MLTALLHLAQRHDEWVATVEGEAAFFKAYHVYVVNFKLRHCRIGRVVLK